MECYRVKTAIRKFIVDNQTVLTSGLLVPNSGVVLNFPIITRTYLTPIVDYPAIIIHIPRATMTSFPDTVTVSRNPSKWWARYECIVEIFTNISPGVNEPQVYEQHSLLMDRFCDRFVNLLSRTVYLTGESGEKYYLTVDPANSELNKTISKEDLDFVDNSRGTGIPNMIKYSRVSFEILERCDNAETGI